MARPEDLDTPSHPRWLRTVRIVSLTQVAVLMGFNFAYPFIPLLIAELGVTDRARLALFTGLAFGGAGIVMAFASPVWGLVADRFGRKAMLVRSIGAGAAILALQGSAVNVWQLVAARLVQGALTGSQTAAAMLLAGVVPRERTGYALSLLNTAVQVGNLIGPVLGGFLVVAVGLRGSFFAGALLLAIVAVITVAFVEDAPRPARDSLPVGMRGHARDVVSPLFWPGLRGVLIVGAVVQMAYSGTAAMIAIFMQDLARPAWLTLEVGVGLALATAALAAAASLPFLGAYADRGDPRRLLAASLLLLGLALIPPVFFPSAIVFLLCRLAIGVASAATSSAIAVLTRRGAPLGGEGRAFGALAAAQNLGWGIGPLAGSAVAALATIPVLYLSSGLLVLALAVPTLVATTWFTEVETSAP